LNVNFTWDIDNFSFRLANDGDEVYSPPFSIDQQEWRVMLWRSDKSFQRKLRLGGGFGMTELLSIRLVPFPRTVQNVSIQAGWEISHETNANGTLLAIYL
jgi:hypothetical protein